MRLQADEWGELGSIWAGSWSHTGRPYRPFDDVVGELVRCRAAGINNLLDIGPMADGNRFSVVWQAEAVGERPPVTAYALVSANDMPDRDPGAWRFLGSQDGVTWILLDERTGEPVWEGRESRREFKTANRTAYADYRFEFVKVHNAAPMFQLSEVELLPPPVVGGTITISPPSGTPESGVRVVKIEPAG